MNYAGRGHREIGPGEIYTHTRRYTKTRTREYENLKDRGLSLKGFRDYQSSLAGFTGLSSGGHCMYSPVFFRTQTLSECVCRGVPPSIWPAFKFIAFG